MPNVRLGMGDQQIASGREFVLDPLMMTKGITIDSTARDANNTPTTTLRKGVVMGIVTATGRYKEYDDGDSDGTQVARGILMQEIDLLDSQGNAQHAEGSMLIFGRVDNNAIYFDAAGDAANGRTDMTTPTNDVLIIFANV